MNVIDGKALAESIQLDITDKVKRLPKRPGVAFIRVGEDPASISYVNIKQRVAERIGIQSILYTFPEKTQERTIRDCIESLNHSADVHGILIQAPLPPHLPSHRLFDCVDPKKDVDGFNSANLGRLLQEDTGGFIPCTPAAILEILSRKHIPTEGQHVVVVGRSIIVGKPTALLLLQKTIGNATVTVVHSKTKNLVDITRQADILIVAIGQPNFIKKHMVKEGTVVIDVGINRVPDASRPTGYMLVGDVDFEKVSPIANYITPVPGGVGPMTVTMLMKNTLLAYYKNNASVNEGLS